MRNKIADMRKELGTYTDPPAVSYKHLIYTVTPGGITIIIVYILLLVVYIVRKMKINKQRLKDILPVSIKEEEENKFRLSRVRLHSAKPNT